MRLLAWVKAVALSERVLAVLATFTALHVTSKSTIDLKLSQSFGNLFGFGLSCRFLNHP
jgi:hypothetical protein